MTSEFQSLIKTKTTASAKTAKDTVLRFLSYWPLFLISLLFFLALGYLYVRFTVPMFAANTIINVKGETSMSRGNQAGGGDLISNAMNGGRSVINLDNELGRLRSARLMLQVVQNSDLNISYYRQGRFTITDIFHDAPFRMIQKDIQDSSQKVTVSISKISTTGFTASWGEETAGTSKIVAWNQPFFVNKNAYVLTPLATGWNSSDKYTVVWSPVEMTVYELLPKVGVNIIGKTSNIALNITIENPKRGEDVLNKMVAAFIQMNLDDQNRAAQDKIYFIEDRLSKISDELKGVEKNLANYQGSNLIVGNDNSASITGESLQATNKAISDIASQKSVLNILRSSLTASDGGTKTLPSGTGGMGFTDPVLGSMVARYNEVVLKKQQQAPLLAPNSLALKGMNDDIQTLRGNILDNLANNIKTLDIQGSSHARLGGQFRSSVSMQPEKLRMLSEIGREKTIKESLYMYLLQKREETALSKTTTTPYEQIDLATSYGPISPDRKLAYIYATLAGLALPVLIIILIGMLNDKISGRDEVEAGSSLTIIGEINNIRKLKNKILPSLEGGIIGEQFRIIRANFNFLQKGTQKQVILITSSASGEGKSFVSLNMAAVLAKTGKKVALLEFDLRKPADSSIEALQGLGINDYLLGEVELDEIVQQIGEVPSLYIYPAGTMTPETGDLIVSDKVDHLFEVLKEKYDCIVINTPPVGLVGDALILQKYSTIIGYVIRQDYTKKKHLQFLNTLVESGKFANTSIIYNGVKTGMKYGYYGYGYAKKNSYFDRKGNNKILAPFKKKTAV